MRLSEKLDHMLRQYNYRRTRASNFNKNNNSLNVEEYLGEVDVYISEVIKEIGDLLPKRGCK